MAKSEAFWNRLADRYAKTPVPDEQVYQTKLAETRRHFRPDMDVFEFGCGTGSTAIAHAPHVRHIRATDFSERMLEIARGKAEAAGIGNVSFEQGDFATMPLPDASYDMVMAHSILHLLKNRDAAIAKAWSILRPGGVFVSSTACLGNTPFALLAPVAPLGQALGLLPQLNVFTRKRLAGAITNAGFTIEHQWLPPKSLALFIIARKPISA